MFKRGDIIIGTEINTYHITNRNNPCVVLNTNISCNQMKVQCLAGIDKGHAFTVSITTPSTNKPYFQLNDTSNLKYLKKLKGKTFKSAYDFNLRFKRLIPCSHLINSYLAYVFDENNRQLRVDIYFHTKLNREITVIDVKVTPTDMVVNLKRG